MNSEPLTPATSPSGGRRPRRRRVGGTRRQHGAIAVLAAFCLIIVVAALGVIDVGNMYFVRRQLQRTADMAALAAAEVVTTSAGCVGAGNVAQSSAVANGFSTDGTMTIQTYCGRWSTTNGSSFSQNATPFNAVQVYTSQAVPYFFLLPGKTYPVTASATATAANIDKFSLGTGLATINTQQSALLNVILGGLLHSNVSLSVADTQSLAATNIALGDLTTALKLGSMQSLLTTSVSYQTLVAAMVTALQTNGDTLNAGILQALAVNIPGGQNITLGDTGGSPSGLLSLGLADPNAAATATVNVLDTVMAAAQIAQISPNGTAPVINVAAGLTGVAGLSLQVINPPVLAIGEAGATPPTVARTAAMNLSLALQPLPTLYLGIATIAALSTPITVTLSVAPGKAQLTNVDCESTKAATQATMQVTPGIASVCVGGNAACTGSINIASISLLGISNVVNVKLKSLGPLSLSPGSTPVTIDGSSGSFDVTKVVNSNALGSDLATLTTTLLNQLPGALTISVAGSNLLGDLLTPILSLLTTTLSPLLQGVFGLLNTLIVPTLSLLGVQVGTATVHNMALTCGVPQLVN
jgi:uncharacterized membrane protein